VRTSAATFLLLHGGSAGGWCFQRVARQLRQAGHDVYTPTLTGFGERNHLARSAISFETHIADVTNVFAFEDLHDVVLVGHSLGSTITPHVAESVAPRIRRVVWLAGMVLRDGQTLLSDAPQSDSVQRALTIDADARPRLDYDLQTETLLHDGSAADRAWLRERLREAPQAALHAPGRLSAFLALGLPTGCVVATRSRVIPLDVARAYAALLPDCRYREVDAGHALMLSAPDATARALLDMV
jgi:pimeloyl-ACP methyl ester carboxylesterase